MKPYCFFCGTKRQRNLEKLTSVILDHLFKIYPAWKVRKIQTQEDGYVCFRCLAEPLLPDGDKRRYLDTQQKVISNTLKNDMTNYK